MASNQPNILLVELGFNDLGWNLSTPDGLLSDMQTFLANARSADPTLTVLIANVVHPWLASTNPALASAIDIYNTNLAKQIGSLSTAASRVSLVDLDSVYHFASDAYDGLHPNPTGEVAIAQAFDTVLSDTYHLGTVPTTTPVIPSALTPQAPPVLTATPTGSGFTLGWPHVFGAGGYWLYSRDASTGAGYARSYFPIAADGFAFNGTVRGDTYAFYVTTARGNYESASASPTATAVANPLTADPPTAITVTPSSAGTTVSWTPPAGVGSDSTAGYTVYYQDVSVGGFPASASTSATQLSLPGLEVGHLYAVAVSTTNAYGEGVWAGAPAFVAGSGVPATPVLLTATATDAQTVQLTWTPLAGTAGYWLWIWDGNPADPYTQTGNEISGTGSSLTVPGVANALAYTFCIQAANGSLTSSLSNCQPVAAAATPSGTRPIARRANPLSPTPTRSDGAVAPTLVVYEHSTRPNPSSTLMPSRSEPAITLPRHPRRSTTGQVHGSG